MASTIAAGTTSGTAIAIAGDTSGVLQLQTNGTTAAVTIDTAQRVGVGTASPGYKFHVANGYGFFSGANYGVILGEDNCLIAGTSATLNSANMVFYTANTERMRITSAGDLLVGTTNSSLTAGQGFKAIYNSGTDPYVGAVMASSSNSQTSYHLYSTGANTFRFYVGMGGTISATSATITTISDRRLKENIVDIDVGLDAVMALKPRKFDWKAGKGKDKKGDRGWIAQEFETVFPEMIDTWKDPAPEGEEPYKAVNADLIPVLVKAIQELKATVDAQAVRIAELEGAK
jgi:hypothetical protein